MKMMKKGVAFLLALVLVAACLTGCGKKDGLTELQKQQKENGGFSVLIPAESEDKAKGIFEKGKERLQALAPEYPITWEYMAKVDGASVLKQQIAAGEYPQVALGSMFQPSDISKFAAEGIILPIEGYINEKDTPNICKMFEANPKIKAALVAPDNHIYTLPGIKDFMPDYIENVMYINKTWLDKVGMEVPKTLPELTEVLRAFKTQDPNGNGKADEIPLSFCPASSSDYPEALLSSWGVATKFGTWDSWLTVQNGEVKFAPVMDEWRAMLEYYRDLYAEGLLDMEVFTQDGSQYTAKNQSPTSIVGCVWSSANPMLNEDEYIAIPPLSADGKIKPVWRIHPGHIGTKDFLVIFNTCQNPQNVLKWADKLYELDESIQSAWGEAAENSTLSRDGDKFKWNDLPDGAYFGSYQYKCILNAGIPCWIPKEVYSGESGIVPVREEWVEKTEIFNMYAPYLDTETWPRPYYSVEEAKDLSILTTDIFSLTEDKRAKWICGQEPLNDETWSAYIAQMKNIGMEDMMDIYQSAYDRYLAGMPE